MAKGKGGTPAKTLSTRLPLEVRWPGAVEDDLLPVHHDDRVDGTVASLLRSAQAILRTTAMVSSGVGTGEGSTCCSVASLVVCGGGRRGSAVVAGITAPEYHDDC